MKRRKNSSPRSTTEDSSLSLPILTTAVNKSGSLVARHRRWMISQWKNGSHQDRGVMLVLAILLLAAVCFLLPSAEPLIIKPTGENGPPQIVGTVKIAGQRRPINFTEPIHIPMEFYDEKNPPSPDMQRFRKYWTQQGLRQTGEQALVQFGEQLREVMLLGADVFYAKSLRSIDSYQASLFRTKIAAMAPWLQGDSSQRDWPVNQVPSPQTADPNSKAIVICAGNKQLPYLDALLHTIRNVHKSTIAIRVVYQGNQDLSAVSQQQLQKKYTSGDLQFLDLSTRFNLQKAQLRGWNLKAFGMLAVPEAQVALLDVDVVLYRPPEALFEQGEYQRTGALFYRDRSSIEVLWSPAEFLLSMQPLLSLAAQKSLVNGGVMNEHIQEAGVVLIDKTRRIRGLWSTCLILGRSDVRKFIQRDIVYGDKEIYFTGFETIHEPYSFARYYPGVIGSVVSDFHGNDVDWSEESKVKDVSKLSPEMALCGRMLHFGDDGLPLWSNGGYLTREDDRKANELAGKALKPILFADGGDSWADERVRDGPKGNQHWDFHVGLGVLCLFPNTRAIRQVPEESVDLGNKAVTYYIGNSRPDAT